MPTPFGDADRRAANTIRLLALDAVQTANSGHAGLPMGMADVAHVIWTRFLRHNPADSHWFNRDRFVLSAGHGSMLLYSLLHLAGYDVSMDELKRFRQWGSITPGHPEHGVTPGVETTTGPLGQGFANGVGMALAERWLAARYNRPNFEVVSHYTYGIVSDGDLQEGISHEAASLAGHLGLGKLIYFYDDNKVTIDGPTSLSYSDDVPSRFAGYHWHTQTVDGHDMAAVEAAILAAQAVHDQPSLIICKTIIGYGMPGLEGTSKAHSDAPGPEVVRGAKEKLGFSPDQFFYVPDEVYAQYRGVAVDAGKELEAKWEELFGGYIEAHSECAHELRQMIEGRLPDNWEQALDAVTFPVEKPQATRRASGTIINAMVDAVPMLLGGSADLTPSNSTKPKDSQDISRDNPGGRYVRYGVREHAMAATMNGLSLHGGVIPYGGTFLTFSDYMKNAVRLSALSERQVIYIFTHDSVGVGEDGPTHQPVEHFPGLRAIPRGHFIRPADATETVEAWRAALRYRRGPTIMALSRQDLPVLDRSKFAPAVGLHQGAYILHDPEGGDPQVILMATGSEVAIIVEAEGLLAAGGVRARLVSMPSWSLFEQQPRAYRESVLPPSITARVSIEAAVTLGWDRYVGPQGVMIGVNRFGASAPYKEIYKHYGLTAERVAEAAEAAIAGRGPQWMDEHDERQDEAQEEGNKQ
jgi:transketolase